MYELKTGEYVKDGKLYGWTGVRCDCEGMEPGSHMCKNCGNTGEIHGIMPTQPSNLPPDTER